MKLKLPAVFGSATQIELQIDDYLRKVEDSGQLFRQAMSLYLREGVSPGFQQLLHQVEALESDSDALRRTIESELYLRTLIPDLRGDVLELMEDVDRLINLHESTLFKFQIERPDFPPHQHAALERLLDTVCACVAEVIQSVRAFFRDLRAVRDYATKVHWLEGEADKQSTELLQALFQEPLPLANKIHLRYFVERIDELANCAESISDRVAIYAIKRRF
ncbi:DUF47 domain-containing protein [Balneatrix alpica]|uniref:DUF47 domain-containing protein n=1 Tax=Balneatrix alpica TaxID=75684 RepID=A0ABV5Z6H5_9GAMM|nr:DUF47 family protein [Balneatrix alpica]